MIRMIVWVVILWLGGALHAQHITDQAGKTYYDAAKTQLKEVFSYREKMVFHPDQPGRMRIQQIKHGNYFKYYPSGKLMIAGRYDNGKADGEWKYYDTEGNIVKREIYRKGILLQTVENLDK